MYIIIYDFGTSTLKTCLFEIDDKIRLVTSASAGFGLYTTDDGGAEQDEISGFAWKAVRCHRQFVRTASRGHDAPAKGGECVHRQVRTHAGQLLAFLKELINTKEDKNEDILVLHADFLGSIFIYRNFEGLRSY